MKIEGYDISLSNQDKIMFPEAGLTKGDLIGYYRRIGKTMLPHIKDRPLTLHRFPGGIDAEGFYQQNASDYFPDWIPRARLGKGDIVTEHCLCQNVATLVYLANQNCITPHSWLSRVDRPDNPDRLIFDLDPGGTDFDLVRKTALALSEVLIDIGLASYVMTTGSRGLHVVVPLDRSMAFDGVRTFARDLAEFVAARAPDELTTEHRKNKRGGRLFLDTTRNAYGQTAVVPYAVRAKPGAPVATPLEWDEIEDSKLAADRYRIKNIFRRLGQKQDPWRTIQRHVVDLRSHRLRLDRLQRRAARRRA